MRMFFCLLLFFGTFVAEAAQKSYAKYQVLRVKIHDENGENYVIGLEKENLYDFWSSMKAQNHVDIMAPPELVDNLKSRLNELSLNWTVMIRDVQALIEMEKIPSEAKHGQQILAHRMDWVEYHSLEDIYEWFDYLETKYEFCEQEIIGESYEGREMRVMKVCLDGCGSKPAMWIDSGIHAREWISPAVGTWMLNELLENEVNHPDLLTKLDWYFLPSVNPDGYHKSREEDRMWRKTTSWYEGAECQGTDANRNWDFHWGEEGGSSEDSCSLNYQGPAPFSEVEVRNVRDFVLAHKEDIKYYQALHSYRQFILFPWGYTEDPAPGYAQLLDLATRGNEALYAVNNVTYTPGCIPCLMYLAAGTSLDWALGVADIPYTYTIELRDTGDYGILLPPSEIIPNAKEVWAFHLVVAEQIINEFGTEYC